MQLYVLGPAFGLPAADAECIAAIAFLQSQGLSNWSIVPTSNTSARLPLLVDGQTHISGFRNIARHFEENPTDSDSNSSVIIPRPKDRADSAALAAFLESNGQPLVDISLYVSFENYRHTTRPAFTKILPWHANYILPPKLRAGARERTENLGVASIDVDNVHEDMSNRPEGFDGVGKQDGGFEKQTQQRASLLLPRKDTIRSLLSRPEHAATFRLHALADNFFEPLQELLGDKEYFLGEEMSSLDCLAYAYLSLMLYPKVPQDWLATTLRWKYTKLVAYTEFMHTKLSMQTNVDEVVTLGKTCRTKEDVQSYRQTTAMVLPWTRSTSSSPVDVLSSTVRAIFGNIPALRPSAQIIHSKTITRSFWEAHLRTLLGVTATAAAAGLYYAFHTRLLVWPTGEAVHIFGRKRFEDYGHLGAALSGLSLLGQQATRDAAYHEQERMDHEPVHVDVEVEGISR